MHDIPIIIAQIVQVVIFLEENWVNTCIIIGALVMAGGIIYLIKRMIPHHDDLNTVKLIKKQGGSNISHDQNLKKQDQSFSNQSQQSIQSQPNANQQNDPKKEKNLLQGPSQQQSNGNQTSSLKKSQSQQISDQDPQIEQEIPQDAFKEKNLLQGPSQQQSNENQTSSLRRSQSRQISNQNSQIEQQEFQIEQEIPQDPFETHITELKKKLISIDNQKKISMKGFPQSTELLEIILTLYQKNKEQKETTLQRMRSFQKSPNKENHLNLRKALLARKHNASLKKLFDEINVIKAGSHDHSLPNKKIQDLFLNSQEYRKGIDLYFDSQAINSQEIDLENKFSRWDGTECSPYETQAWPETLSDNNWEKFFEFELQYQDPLLLQRSHEVKEEEEEKFTLGDGHSNQEKNQKNQIHDTDDTDSIKNQRSKLGFLEENERGEIQKHQISLSFLPEKITNIARRLQCKTRLEEKLKVILEQLKLYDPTLKNQFEKKTLREKILFLYSSIDMKNWKDAESAISDLSNWMRQKEIRLYLDTDLIWPWDLLLFFNAQKKPSDPLLGGLFLNSKHLPTEEWDFYTAISKNESVANLHCLMLTMFCHNPDETSLSLALAYWINKFDQDPCMLGQIIDLACIRYDNLFIIKQILTRHHIAKGKGKLFFELLDSKIQSTRDGTDQIQSLNQGNNLPFQIQIEQDSGEQILWQWHGDEHCIFGLDQSKIEKELKNQEKKTMLVDFCKNSNNSSLFLGTIGKTRKWASEQDQGSQKNILLDEKSYEVYLFQPFLIYYDASFCQPFKILEQDKKPLYFLKQEIPGKDQTLKNILKFISNQEKTTMLVEKLINLLKLIESKKICCTHMPWDAIVLIGNDLKLIPQTTVQTLYPIDMKQEGHNFRHVSAGSQVVHWLKKQKNSSLLWESPRSKAIIDLFLNLKASYSSGPFFQKNDWSDSELHALLSAGEEKPISQLFEEFLNNIQKKEEEIKKQTEKDMQQAAQACIQKIKKENIRKTFLTLKANNPTIEIESIDPLQLVLRSMTKKEEQHMLKTYLHKDKETILNHIHSFCVFLGHECNSDLSYLEQELDLADIPLDVFYDQQNRLLIHKIQESKQNHSMEDKQDLYDLLILERNAASSENLIKKLNQNAPLILTMLTLLEDCPTMTQQPLKIQKTLDWVLKLLIETDDISDMHLYRFARICHQSDNQLCVIQKTLLIEEDQKKPSSIKKLKLRYLLQTSNKLPLSTDHTDNITKEATEILNQIEQYPKLALSQPSLQSINLYVMRIGCDLRSNPKQFIQNFPSSFLNNMWNLSADQKNELLESIPNYLTPEEIWTMQCAFFLEMYSKYPDNSPISGIFCFLKQVPPSRISRANHSCFTTQRKELYQFLLKNQKNQEIPNQALSLAFNSFEELVQPKSNSDQQTEQIASPFLMFDVKEIDEKQLQIIFRQNKSDIPQLISILQEYLFHTTKHYYSKENLRTIIIDALQEHQQSPKKPLIQILKENIEKTPKDLNYTIKRETMKNWCNMSTETGMQGFEQISCKNGKLTYQIGGDYFLDQSKLEFRNPSFNQVFLTFLNKLGEKKIPQTEFLTIQIDLDTIQIIRESSSLFSKDPPQQEAKDFIRFLLKNAIESLPTEKKNNFFGSCSKQYDIKNEGFNSFDRLGQMELLACFSQLLFVIMAPNQANNENDKQRPSLIIMKK